MSLKAVVFDVDGVLVQSMERHHEAYQAALAPLGVRIEPREVFAQEGRRSREVLENIARERELGLTEEQLDALNKVKQRTFVSFGPMPLYPGVRELLDRLHANGLRLAMVTGTARVNVDNHFGDLTRRFDAIVTADDVKRTKPDPEPYQQALRKLGLPASACLVVENAPLGVKSAKAAGIRVVAITTTNDEATLRAAGAEWVVPRIAEVGRVVEAVA